MPPASLIYKDCCVHNELKEPHLQSGHCCISEGFLLQRWPQDGPVCMTAP